MQRLERLVNLVLALLDANRPLTREEIRTRVAGYADEAGAFRRNFERDKELLRQMGIPLAVEPVDPRRPEGVTGYRVRRERYELPEPGLAEDELAALRLAASAVELEGEEGRDAATTALWKLAAGTGADGGPVPADVAPGPQAAPGAGTGADPTGADPTGADPTGADPTGADPTGAGPTGADPTAGEAGHDGPVGELPAGDHVAVLFGAAATRQRVRFAYRGAVREVDPWRLSYRNGQWYLTGWDHARADSRTYRLDRLQSRPELLGPPGAFIPPAAADAAPPPPWQLGDDAEVVAEVLVDAVQADWAAAAVGEPAVAERRPDGAVLLKLAVTNVDAFRSFVLGFLDHAEVIGPPALRDGMIDWLEGLAVGAVTGRAR